MQPEEHPKGTFAILIIFLLVMIIIWVGLYLMVLQRGGV